MKVEDPARGREGARHRILFADPDLAGRRLDHRDDADVDGADRRGIVVQQTDDPRPPSPGNHQLLVDLPTQRVANHVPPIDRVHMAADADRAEPVQAPLRPSAGALEAEDLPAADDQRVGDDLLQRRVLLHAGALREPPLPIDARQMLLHAAHEAVRGPTGEEAIAPHHVDLLRHGRAAGPRSPAPST